VARGKAQGGNYLEGRGRGMAPSSFVKICILVLIF